jgi:predicted RNA-binding Zn-ribbon protein involved in translation (DUF1610 family)
MDTDHELALLKNRSNNEGAIMGGKCPACGKPVLGLRGGTTDVTFPGGTFKTIVFQCPNCTAVLGAQIDLEDRHY